MKETHLQNAFEFATQLMNNLVMLKDNEFRCSACDYSIQDDSCYVFNFEFSSLKLNDKITFSYFSDDDSDNCYFDVIIKKSKDEIIDLKTVVYPEKSSDIDLFQCASYSGNFTNKVQGFIAALDAVFESRTTILNND